jgi:condensin complex subunit 1
LEDPFIKKWVEVIEDIVKKFQNGNEIEVISVLSYCKFMCLSPSYCSRKIQPILNLLIQPNINSVVKNNIIIAMGDLLHRFPNIVEPYNHYLYRNLQDKDIGVRKTTLTVLTHLSLNDMIKVRSDLCDIALLFQDECE